MSLAETLLPKLADWRPAGEGRHAVSIALPDHGWTVGLTADRADSVGCRLTQVEAVSPRVVRFHLKAPLATFMTDIDFGIVSFHGGPPRSDRVIGAGPYRLVRLTSTGASLEEEEREEDKDDEREVWA